VLFSSAFSRAGSVIAFSSTDAVNRFLAFFITQSLGNLKLNSPLYDLLQVLWLNAGSHVGPIAGHTTTNGYIQGSDASARRLDPTCMGAGLQLRR
jgi:hypothetical protein